MVKTRLVLLASVFALLLTVLPVFQPVAQAAKCKSETGLSLLNIKPWYSGLCKAGTDEVRIEKIPGDIIILALNVLSIAVQIAGYVAVGFVIWGGIKYILSQGESAKVASAKNIIINAMVGLLIVLVALTAVDFLVSPSSGIFK